MQLQSYLFPCEIYTGNFQVEGQFRTIGNINIFLNDESNFSFELLNATVKPIAQGVRVKPLNPLGPAYVPRTEVQAMILGNLDNADVQLLPRTQMLTCYTDTYIIRGDFHLPTEARVGQVFKQVKATFFPVTNAQIYTMRPITYPVSGEADMLFINSEALCVYYVED